FCRRCVDLVLRSDRQHRLDVVPFQDQERVARFGIPLPALAAAMHLMLPPPDGRVLAGAAAAPEILRLLPRWRWLAGGFRLPAGPMITNDAYKVIRALDGVTDVNIEIVWEPYWTPEKMDPKVRALMGL